MPVSLSRELRNDLAKVTKAARTRAEDAARAALENLAVHERQARGHMDENKRKLRAQLRARGKALGDSRQPDGTQSLTRLVEHAACEHWHRLLFTRFLTENHLLLMPDDAGGAPTPVTLEECEELAPELGAKDGFDLACRFASKTLPGVFRIDDPALELTFAPEGQVALRKLLDSLPREVFTADDALGWTYQFWQAQRKDEVNKSGKKIGAAELSPVTQLFTEDYMVEFLLHNTLGAWWAGRCATISNSKFQIANCPDEAVARAAVGLAPRNGVPGIEWNYLRFVQDGATKAWTPAAGTFPNWPKTAREITMLDPCMGSGHFLVFALPLLVRLRMEEEGMSTADAVFAVVRDNLHGLELDERCTQIAAFNVALTAWKLAGYQPLPALYLACSGLAPHTTQAEWIALAGTDEKLQRGMARLYKLFEGAPVLGSLINPRSAGGDLLTAGFDELRPLVEKALAPKAGDETALDVSAEALAKVEMAVTARGLAKAAEILAGQFTLVATNVPYLGRGKQDDGLKDYCERNHVEAKADLATCFVERCLSFCEQVGSIALVTPQNWWFLGTYSAMREHILSTRRFNFIVTLGEEAWQSFGDRGPVAGLMIVDKSPAIANHRIAGIDALSPKSIARKISEIETGNVRLLVQADQYASADHRLTVDPPISGPLLKRYATCNQGIGTADANRYIAKFWEVISSDIWEFYQMAPVDNRLISGCHSVVRWERGNGSLATSPQARVCGQPAWGKRGVAVAVTRDLYRALYLGGKFDCTLGALISVADCSATEVSAFVFSDEFLPLVRQIDKALSVTESSLLKVPFDLAHWQKMAVEKYPHGLPKPFSSDPTQWPFNGNPAGADQPLHVALARLLGYRWPRQTGSSFPYCPALDADGLEKFADEDGIVCLPPINREAPAASRLRHLLAAALGTYDERALLAAAGPKGSKAKTLEDWLRDEFFEQHCALFHDRPFVWHLWDGLKDGFQVLVNYHRLDHGTLEKLTFSYLGEWIRQQADDAKADKPGAAARLGAAQALQQKLAAILEGEAPLDIFVRWKPLNEQAISWHPDLNDGVRQNIRPFLLVGDVGKKGAGLFRSVPLKLKENDRGTEPERPKKDYPWFWCDEDPGTDPKGGHTFVGTRWNSAHLTLASKRTARAAKSE